MKLAQQKKKGLESIKEDLKGLLTNSEIADYAKKIKTGSFYHMQDFNN